MRRVQKRRARTLPERYEDYPDLIETPESVLRWHARELAYSAMRELTALLHHPKGVCA
jgi:hypothetical protein